MTTGKTVKHGGKGNKDKKLKLKKESIKDLDARNPKAVKGGYGLCTRAYSGCMRP